jgi:long-chain acyl-CoA synthetase
MLTRMLCEAVNTAPGKAAVVQGNRRVTYEELGEMAARFGAGLIRRGIGSGDCVAVVLPHGPEFVASLFGCATKRAVLLPIDPASGPEEVESTLADANARLVVTDRLRAKALRRARVPVVEFEALAADWTDQEPLGEFRGPVLYLHTSGSTSTRKRLCFTQENLFWEARNFVETVGLSADDHILCTIPLWHSYGMGNCLLDAIDAQTSLILLEEDDTPFVGRCRRVVELIRDEQVRFYPGVPYQFQILSDLPDGATMDLSGLRLCVSSGDFLPRSTYDRFLQRYGLPIRSLYGSTEAGSIAINVDPAGQVEAGSVGPPLRNVAIEIRDAEGKELPTGVDGEIWVKSPTIPPSGSGNRCGLDHEALRGGFYRTGDNGHLDHRGHLILAGRNQSFINIAGNKVDTSEVEEVLRSCPGVREAAVLGVEIPRVGNLLKAALVTDGPCRPSEIWEFCRHRLAFYKVPRLIEIHPSLPRGAMGKVLKSELGGVESYLEGIRNGEAAQIVGRLSTVFSGKRRSMVTSLVQAQVAAVLGQSIETVPRDVGFVELGMDSFGAIDLRARLEYLFDRELPQTFTFDHPTVDAITDRLMSLVEKG